jgi:hypothetical protein
MANDDVNPQGAENLCVGDKRDILEGMLYSINEIVFSKTYILPGFVLCVCNH